MSVARPQAPYVPISAKEAASIIGVTEGVLAKWRSHDRRVTDSPEIKPLGPPFVTVSARCIRYSKAAVHAWLAERAVGNCNLQLAAD